VFEFSRQLVGAAGVGEIAQALFDANVDPEVSRVGIASTGEVKCTTDPDYGG